jgi:hypothetical protein
MTAICKVTVTDINPMQGSFHIGWLLCRLCHDIVHKRGEINIYIYGTNSYCAHYVFYKIQILQLVSRQHFSLSRFVSN